MIQPEAEAISAAVHLIRDDWVAASMVTLLSRHQHRSARDVLLALIYVALDPETEKPGRIDADGPWWRVTQIGKTTERPSYLLPQPPIPREPDPASPERIREIRAAIHHTEE